MSYGYVVDSEIPSDETDQPVQEEAEMLDCCLPGSFLNCKNGSWPKMGTCPGFMSTRCSGIWDKACDIYLGSLQKEEGRDFLNETFKRKYCIASKINSPLGCQVECDQFNPNDPDSVAICYQKGMKGFYLNEDGSIRDTDPNLDPTEIQPCDKAVLCDVKDLDMREPLIQRCMTWGACNTGGISNQNGDYLQFIDQESPAMMQATFSPATKKTIGHIFVILVIVTALILLFRAMRRKR